VAHTTHAPKSSILGQEAQAIVEESFKHLHITPRWATIAMWENVWPLDEKLYVEKPKNLVPETPEIIVGHVSFLVFCIEEVVNFFLACMICP